MPEQIFRSALTTPRIDLPPVRMAARHAAAEPDRLAIVDGATGERVSRGELARRAAGVAEWLDERGVGRGERVAIALPTGAAWAAVALGVWRAGAVLVPLNPAWTAGERDRLLALAKPVLTLDTEPAHLPSRDPFAAPRVQPSDLALIPFSSGTGGLPKGVRLTHANLSAMAAGMVAVLSAAGPFGAEHRVLAGVPFFHVMGLATALAAPLRMGAQTVTQAPSDAGRALALIAEHGVTHAVVAPPLVEELASLRTTPATGLRMVGTGGAHVPAAVQRRAGERLGCLVRQGYGMTEACPISAPLERPSDPATVGWLAPGIEARVDAAGELWIRGPQVTAGYYEDPAATAATIDGAGWLRTGDVVRIREDGQVVIVDRLKELIKVGGAHVAPAELALVLREHAAVRDAAVIGSPDGRDGELPVAFVVPAGPVSETELLAFANARLAAHKALHAVRLTDRIPRLPSGKLQRRLLGS